jgi:hypothetical protein
MCLNSIGKPNVPPKELYLNFTQISIVCTYVFLSSIQKKSERERERVCVCVGVEIRGASGRFRNESEREREREREREVN